MLHKFFTKKTICIFVFLIILTLDFITTRLKSIRLFLNTSEFANSVFKNSQNSDVAITKNSKAQSNIKLKSSGLRSLQIPEYIPFHFYTIYAGHEKGMHKCLVHILFEQIVLKNHL